MRTKTPLIRPAGRLISELFRTSRFAAAFLFAVSMDGARGAEPLWQIVKPDREDGRALIVRLFTASGQTERVSLAWSDPAPVKRLDE